MNSFCCRPIRTATSLRDEIPFLKDTMLLDADLCQLVLVDCQPRLLAAMSDGQLIGTNALRLAQMASGMQVPLCITEQNPAKLGESLPEL